MTSLKLSDRITSAKIWLQKTISGKDTRAKIPRKKVQLQFEHTYQQYQKQVSLLQLRLSRPGLSTSAMELGQHLMQDVQRFQELHLIQINQNRLENLPQQLLHPVDFSMWVLYQMYYYTETIFHYLKTCEGVEL